MMRPEDILQLAQRLDKARNGYLRPPRSVQLETAKEQLLLLEQSAERLRREIGMAPDKLDFSDFF